MSPETPLAHGRGATRRKWEFRKKTILVRAIIGDAEKSILGTEKKAMSQLL